MANIIYRTTIYKDTTDVVGIDIGQNNADKTDFETNYKSQAVTITDVAIGEDDIISDLSFTAFKTKVTSWTNVQYVENTKKYVIYLFIGFAFEQVGNERILKIAGNSSATPIPISGTISQTAISPAKNLYRQSLFAPLVANTWRNFIRFTVPTGKKMLIHNFSSLSSAAATRTRVAIKENLATYNYDTNTFTKLFNAEADRFFSNIDFIVTTALVNTATFNITVTYTNQDGITGRTATIQTASPLGLNKRSLVMTLQGDDYGVREITNITEANTTVTGQITIQGYEILLEEVEQTANKKHYRFFASNQAQGIIIESGKTVDIDIFSTSITNYTRNAEVTYSLI